MVRKKQTRYRSCSLVQNEEAASFRTKSGMRTIALNLAMLITEVICERRCFLPVVQKVVLLRREVPLRQTVKEREVIITNITPKG